jgi:hypothetical protein
MVVIFQKLRKIDESVKNWPEYEILKKNHARAKFDSKHYKELIEQSVAMFVHHAPLTQVCSAAWRIDSVLATASFSCLEMALGGKIRSLLEDTVLDGPAFIKFFTESYDTIFINSK